MKKSLKDMINEKQNNLNQDEEQQLKDFAKKAKPYENMSKDQLLGEIIKKKNASKNIDNKSLNEFAQKLSPMLDKEQRNRLKSILNQLKD